jgi:anthraniloyl-CoA monooxygenase
MFTPYTVRGLTLKNRVVVSPMAQYKAVDGVPATTTWCTWAPAPGRRRPGDGRDDLHLARRPHHPRLPRPVDRRAGRRLARIVDFVHAHSDAAIGMQIGHAGPKGSTNAPGTARAPTSRWPRATGRCCRRRPCPICPTGKVPRAMTAPTWTGCATTSSPPRAAPPRPASTGWSCTAPTATCCQLHLAADQPARDDYGGSLDNRLRYPLEVFAAVRAAWPAERPMSVRISAHDWVDGGITPDDAVAIARAFKAAGADLIDCSSGQVSAEQKPTYGRMYQTPFADRIRQEAGIATIAVGAISEADHVNSIIAAGRADLCAVARPHLANPAWTLTEAARIGYTPQPWPRRTARPSRSWRSRPRSDAACASASASACRASTTWPSCTASPTA